MFKCLQPLIFKLKLFNSCRKYQYNEDDFQLKFLIFTKLSISMDTQITWKQREAANEQSFTLISRKLVI